MDYMGGGAGDDSISGGNDTDIIYGLAGNDRLWGDAGDDALIADDFDDAGNPIGNPAATDKLDGGAHIDGDICVVLAAGSAVNCEMDSFPADSSGLSAKSAGGAGTGFEAPKVKAEASSAGARK